MNLITETLPVENEKDRSAPPRAFCDLCGRRVQLIAFNDAESILSVDRKAFCRLSREGKVHWIQRSTGLIMACLRSVERETIRKAARIIVLQPLHDDRVY